ncbi:STAS domain-containing protein [Bacillus sp. FJAT-42376]|uniref:STAS domain-containing protein n=1 Tax=Bacillus sp. FJAT-42376 TaxID=2014076 RepID=UPI000F4D7BE1|nr:STAS domain-containing protein [Bacillus sp. FJAT-42376]AZB41776.1 STAS domain-containing protein [Bacillus sp. FJAT-42376]
MIHSIKNFDEAAEMILRFMSGVVPLNTLFIAKNDQRFNEIEKVVNRDYVLLSNGETMPFQDTFCKLSVDHGNRILLIEDLNQNELTKDMDVTRNLAGGSFIGIPINYSTGENYGTICGLDSKTVSFEEEHVELFTTMASLLSYVLDLDKVNREIEELSAPMVPLTDGVAVLPIIGDISEKRAQIIIQSTLKQSSDRSLQYLILDLSGILRVNRDVIHHLVQLANMLSLIGVTPILTGILPVQAQNMVQSNLIVDGILVKKSLAAALSHIGFALVEKDRRP